MTRANEPGSGAVSKPLAIDPGQGAIIGLAFLFFGLCTATSWARWANFEYRTFDLAYYVQALWQFIHGRFGVSVLGVPLLGNHVEPIVFLFAPLFFVFRHPMVLVAVQNAALASMGPIAFQIALRLGLSRMSAFFLGGAILFTPATGFVALHEFHPEALAAPFLLLMLQARLRGSLRAHWCWMLAVLACKENMALLIVAYCGIHLFLERTRPRAELRAWYFWPMTLSLLWLIVCVTVISPALNAGSIDYLSLYDRLGTSAGDILLKAFTQPSRLVEALSQSLTQGNLLWALLLPFLALPLLRPRWFMIALPVLLQHLLSSRFSEWSIYFHYAAPLIPLFWMALAESVAGVDRKEWLPVVFRKALPLAVLIGCITAQANVGPAGGVVATARSWFGDQEERARKKAFLRQIPPGASVVAPLPYLSHLALRENLFSLHFILKGLRTLSRAAYEPPPPTDVVLIDYDDTATFDPDAGYYHPAMHTVERRVISSSERLLHEFLKERSWSENSTNGLTLFRQEAAPNNAVNSAETRPNSLLISCTKSSEVLSGAGLEIRTTWNFGNPREIFPWMFLKLTRRDQGSSIVLSRGLSSPQSTSGPAEDTWRITPSRRIPAGNYSVEAWFVDNSRQVWAEKSGRTDSPAFLLVAPVPLGELRVTGSESTQN